MVPVSGKPFASSEIHRFQRARRTPSALLRAPTPIRKPDLYSYEAHFQKPLPRGRRHCICAVSADTVTANATARTLTPNQGDQGALSLFSDGVSNIQRSWLNFDLSAYSGKAMVGDVTMTLQAGIFGNSLTGVQLGSANAMATDTPPVTQAPTVVATADRSPRAQLYRAASLTRSGLQGPSATSTVS